MNLYPKRAAIARVFFLTILFFAIIYENALARVYVYEVTTAATRFQTASKLGPDAFLMYNGGYDIIYNLKVLAVYPDKDMQKALKDFKLEKNNVFKLPFTPIPDRIPKLPYYWWR